MADGVSSLKTPASIADDRAVHRLWCDACMAVLVIVIADRNLFTACFCWAAHVSSMCVADSHACQQVQVTSLAVTAVIAGCDC